jgi:hypothetical protein
MNVVPRTRAHHGGTFMLTIHDGGRHPSRRAFLQIGSLAHGGLT